MGLIADGINSLMRYYLNNFTDGTRQDAMDLFYGHYSVRLDDYYSPFIYHFERSLLVAPLVMILSIILLLRFFISGGGSFTFRLFGTIGTVIAFILAAMIVLQNGVHYVQYPRLRPPPIAAITRPWTRLLAEPNRKLREALLPSRKVHVI